MPSHCDSLTPSSALPSQAQAGMGRAGSWEALKVYTLPNGQGSGEAESRVSVGMMGECAVADGE